MGIRRIWQTGTLRAQDAVLVFAMLSPIFETRDEYRYLLKKLWESANLTAADQTAIAQALAWLDQA